jgi:ubiquinone/menaquinone biosynthesis C-methylase UbiE
MRAPKVLDLGAGGAPWSIAMLKGCPDGTAVINDLPGVIDVATAKTAEHEVAERCEFRPGDFHSIDIEPDMYDIVVLGHICRTEGAAGAQHLIARAFEALKPEGRLILADYFPDIERKFNPHAVIMGTTMMASTEKGFCFTHQQFSEWIRAAGFVELRLVDPLAFNRASSPRNRETPENTMTEQIDTLIVGSHVVTMNATRDVIRHGAVAVRGNQIVDVGKQSDLEALYTATATVGGDRFVVTPGMVNTHIHVTGEPLTRGFVPDDTPFEENVFMWLCPLYAVYTAEEERLSAQLAAVEMLKSGTTTFLEAGHYPVSR